MESNNNELIARIEYLCSITGESKRQMELRCGFSSGMISKWRKYYPTAANLEKVAKHFNVSTDYLLGKSEYKTSTEEFVDKYKSSKKLEGFGIGVKIPVLGEVVAGIPIEAVQDVISYEEITADLASRGEYFGLQIKGDSMSPRMLEGDVVIVRSQNTANTGDVVISQFEDNSGIVNSCVKRFVKTDSGIVLQSYNPSYNPIVFSNAEADKQHFQIIGKVIELRGKFN